MELTINNRIALTFSYIKGENGKSENLARLKEEVGLQFTTCNQLAQFIWLHGRVEQSVQEIFESRVGQV